MPVSASTAANNFSYNEPNDRQAGTLVMTERWWGDRYNEIAERGYKLRPRYRPKWEPSWFKTGKDFYSVEDGQATILRAAMDATRTRDGHPVMLKKVLLSDGPHELRINKLFSSPEHSRERDNYCAPLLDVIELSTRFESQQLMVFPLLRPFNQPRIQTFGEFAAFFTQICEGIRFMHQRNVAHRDCTANNIMFDSSKMYPKGFHPVKIDRNRNFKGTAKAYTRTQRPPRYYFIDLGLSRLYHSRDATDEPLRGGDKSAPEHRSGRRCNPFHTDIYYIGNLIRQEFMEKCNGFEFMNDLITSMTQDNPAERPPIEEVLQEFSRIRASLSKRKLRSAITSKNSPKLLGMFRQARQSLRTVRYIVSRRPAIPDPYT
ncbi:kinase-like domain-containing protein [Lactarius sanguifluus]|nr:kinase-like domain-containing protein [Lactarius sanguifluus]